MMNKKKFAQKIVGWYMENRRNLPWRETSDPYKIWLSEIILQQTRVAQGLPYYLRFIERFPTIGALARATDNVVLREWQGLGYYTRARNLHRCAKTISNDFKGIFPGSYRELLNLPGIGPYTAAAIASISFREKVAVVDGNVFRVLARVFGIDEDIATGSGKEYFFEFAQTLIVDEEPHLFNQAVMEFGALHCTPKNPSCDDCIFRRSCVAFSQGLQQDLPVKGKKMKTRKRYFTYFVFQQAGKVGMQKRTANDIWKGLFDFYLIESSRVRKPETLLRAIPYAHLLENVSIERASGLHQHALSHQRLFVRFVHLHLKPGANAKRFLLQEKLELYSMRQAQRLPKPILVERFLSENLVL